MSPHPSIPKDIASAIQILAAQGGYPTKVDGDVYFDGWSFGGREKNVSLTVRLPAGWFPPNNVKPMLEAVEKLLRYAHEQGDRGVVAPVVPYDALRAAHDAAKALWAEVAAGHLTGIKYMIAGEEFQATFRNLHTQRIVNAEDGARMARLDKQRVEARERRLRLRIAHLMAERKVKTGYGKEEGS